MPLYEDWYFPMVLVQADDAIGSGGFLILLLLTLARFGISYIFLAGITAISHNLFANAALYQQAVSGFSSYQLVKNSRAHTYEPDNASATA